MTDTNRINTQKPAGRQLWTVCGVVCLLLVLFLQLAFSVRQDSISWDEGDHLFTGYMMWRHDDFGLNPEHPPLVKLVAALPLLSMQLRVPELQHRQFKLEAFLDGRNFTAWNYSKGILFRARMAVSVFTLLLALLIFFAAREMFGAAAGFIALTLFVFDPNFLAHGALVTTDVGVSCFIFGSIYGFYRYVKAPSVKRLLIAGGMTGLAFASKHTGILLLPMLLALAICESLRRDAGGRRARNFARLTGAFIATALIGFVVLWAFYGFRYSARPLSLSLNPPLTTYLQQISRPFDARVIGAIAHLHLLPESYLFGLTDILFINEIYTAYFFGTIYPHGTWLYFPGVLLIKSTLPFLILVLTAIILIATRRLRCWREILFLTVPPAIYLAVSMSSHINIGVRHILPMYPFLYVLAAGAAATLIRTNKRWSYAIAILLLWQAFEAVHIFPAYMAYANEAWGGPANTHKYLSDSNVDWGQQLIAVKRYLDKHRITKCWFVYFPEGAVDPSPYGIPCNFLPTTDTLWWLNVPLHAPPSIDGTVLISDGDLEGFEFGPGPLNPYEQFKRLKPVAVIQHGVYVYQGHFDIPLAAAYSDDQVAQNLLDAKNAAALPKAQEAFALAPNAVLPNAVLGDVLTALGHPGEARPHYEKALHLARTVQPVFQEGWVPAMKAKLATK
ncbi:MAG TPA: glycosyltransferase family 39 protein [Acidobacteriaceae bacterium]|nr:glycosyltransferase family 39 protein [Acidobacteriaceae bacterium]